MAPPTGLDTYAEGRALGLNELVMEVLTGILTGEYNDTSTFTVPTSATVNVTVTTLNPVTATTSTLTNVASSATSVTLLASTAGRLGATFFNDSTASCFVKFGTTASATSFTIKMAPGAYYEVPTTSIALYTGRIDGIWDAANGNMRVTELSA